MLRGTLMIALAAAAFGCDSGSGTSSQLPDSTAAEASLDFLHPAAGAPPLADRQVSFWAVRGQTREGQLMYRPMAGHTDSLEFARLLVFDQSLTNRPDGSPIAPGDSILITLSVIDTLRLIVDCQPAGLVFSSAAPPRFWIRYGESDPDLNHDGSVNAADTTLLNSLHVWRQEHPGDLWALLPGYVDVDPDVQGVNAEIPGFTRFAVAY
jgi:hypothetical protein